MELGATSALIKKNIFFLKIAPKNVFYKKMFNTLVPLIFYFHILNLKNQDPVKLNTLLSYSFFHITYAETGKQKRKWPIFLCFYSYANLLVYWYHPFHQKLLHLNHQKKFLSHSWYIYLSFFIWQCICIFLTAPSASNLTWPLSDDLAARV